MGKEKIEFLMMIFENYNVIIKLLEVLISKTNKKGIVFSSTEKLKLNHLEKIFQ